jgi:hypothetical protein
MRLMTVVLLSLLAATSYAAEWSTIVPGQSTAVSVRERWGAPTRMTTQKEEGFDTDTWIYEGAQAPAGMMRVVVDFGLKNTTGYHRDIVRVLRLEPRAGVFDRDIIVNGWGPPDQVGSEQSSRVFLYKNGLFVYFDEDKSDARVMIFTVPQPFLPESPKRLH